MTGEEGGATRAVDVSAAAEPEARQRFVPFALNGWIVRPASNCILLGDVRTELTPMAMQVLCLLAQYPGDVVSRDDLIRVVWAGNYLTGAKRLNDEIWRLRSALGDDPKNPTLIKTVPRRGYVLLATPQAWTEASDADVDPAGGQAEASDDPSDQDAASKSIAPKVGVDALPRAPHGAVGAGRASGTSWLGTSLSGSRIVAAALVVAVGLAAILFVLYRQKSEALDRLSVAAYEADLAEQAASSFVLELLSGVSVSDAMSRRDVARAVVERAQLILPAYSGSVALQVRIRIALSRLAFEFGDRTQAEQLAGDAQQRAAQSQDSRLQVDATLHLARMLRMNGRPQDSEALYREAVNAIDAQPRQPRDDLLMATALEGIGVTSSMQGRHEDAERLIGEALERRRTLLGVQHEETARAMMNLGIALSYIDDRRQEGADLLESGSSMLREALGPESPTVGLSFGSVGAALVVGGRLDEGVRYMEEGLAVVERALGAGSYETSQIRLNLAEAQFERRATEAVRQHLETAERLTVQHSYDSTEQQAHLHLVRGKLSWLEGNPDAAFENLTEALRLITSVYGADGPEVRHIVRNRCDLIQEFPALAARGDAAGVACD